MQKHYILIDYENIPASFYKLMPILDDERCYLMVFLGPNNVKLDTMFVSAVKSLGERGELFQQMRAGNNALDFYITYTIGRLAVGYPDAQFHIVSHDTGFDPLIETLQKQRIAVTRSDSIYRVPCFRGKESERDLPPWERVKSGISREKLLKKCLHRVRNELLSRRKNGMPKHFKTLYNSVQNLFGGGVDEDLVNDLIAKLKEDGDIELIGQDVVYKDDPES